MKRNEITFWVNFAIFSVLVGSAMGMSSMTGGTTSTSTSGASCCAPGSTSPTVYCGSNYPNGCPSGYYCNPSCNANAASCCVQNP